MPLGSLVRPEDAEDVQHQASRSPEADPQLRDLRAAHDYRIAKHLEASAHHLKAASEAQRRGEKDVERRHRLMYDLHRKALGLHKELGVPAVIRARLSGAKINERTRGYTQHPADGWVLRK